MLSFLGQFENFCRSKPADEEYTYMDAVNCPCAMFATSLGMDQEYLGHSEPKVLRKMIEDGTTYEFVELEIYAATTPHTYGALADRIRDRVHDDGIFAK